MERCRPRVTGVEWPGSAGAFPCAGPAEPGVHRHDHPRSRRGQQLGERRDLAMAVSADALFTLTDLCGLSGPDAVDSAVRTARTLTAAAFAAG